MVILSVEKTFFLSCRTARIHDQQRLRVLYPAFFFKSPLLDVRNVTFEPGIYWLGSGHRLKVLVGESAPVTAKKTLSDEGTDCPDLLDIESNFTLLLRDD